MCLPGLVLTQRFKQHLEQIGFDSRFPLAHPGLVLLIAVILIGERGFKAESKYKSFFFLVHRTPQELSDIDRSTAANDPRPSASFSTRKNAQRIPANTPPVFSGLRPSIWSRLTRLVTKAMSDRFLADCEVTGPILHSP